MIRVIIGLAVLAAAIYFGVKLWAVHWILTVLVTGLGGYLGGKIIAG